MHEIEAYFASANITRQGIKQLQQTIANKMESQKDKPRPGRNQVVYQSVALPPSKALNN